MAFTEFYCRPDGSNLNAGSEDAASARLTYASGNWVAATGVFTVASGDPATDGVVVGDFASVYPDGSTVAVFVGRVTARDATTITVSLTAKSGTAPTDGTGNRTLKIGGAWKGPNGTEGFPFDFAAQPMMNASNDACRVNLKNTATYSITAAMTHAVANGPVFQGCSSTPGDGGRATIDGGTSGASYVLLTISADGSELVDVILQNNGATGTSSGLVTSAGASVRRCVVHDVRGSGFSLASSIAIECEAYNCNGVGFASINSTFLRCFSHNNSDSNVGGFVSGGNSSMVCIECIAAENGAHGFGFRGRWQNNYMLRCDAYFNGGHGLSIDPNTSSNAYYYVESCNFVRNGGAGVDDAEASLIHIVRLVNCGFGSGTMANTSGPVSGLDDWGAEEGSVIYPADVTPWVDPDNGDFRVSLAEAKGAGRGAFTQTAAGYAGTVGYPDIGAVQHQDAGGGGSGIGGRVIGMGF